MESKKVYNYIDIIREIKYYFECKIHPDNKYIAYCSICEKNICEKCLNNNIIHIGHKIYYFQNIIHTEEQIKYFYTIIQLTGFYLRRIKERIIDMLSDFSDFIKNEKNENYQLLLNIKNQLRNEYKFYYKSNFYQLQYAKKNLELYTYCRKWGYINFQIFQNIYNIRINSIKIPELADNDIIKKTEIMINFFKDNNNILNSYNSEHPSKFYSYLYIKNKNPKIKIFDINLSSFIFDSNKGEIFTFEQMEINSNRISNNDTFDTGQIKENNNNNSINIEGKNNINNGKRENNSISINQNKKSSKEEDMKNFNKKLNDIKENLSKINYNIKNHTVEINKRESGNKNRRIYKEVKYNYDSKNKNNRINQQKLKIINNKNLEIESKNYIFPKEKIKEIIYANLPKPCNEEVEYREDIKYIYLDKNNKKEISCSYHGEFKKGTQKRHGRGLFVWDDGEFYLGYWANDKREGIGKNTYKNGNTYEGNYKKGKKEGDGIYKWKNGDKYTGKWKNDMKEGKGIYEYSNGDVYEGNFKKDMIHGNGVYTWANKITFRGEFKNNLIDKEP